VSLRNISTIDILLEEYKIHLQIFLMSLAGLVAAFLSIFLVLESVPQQITPLIILDYYGIIFLGLIILTSLSIVLISYGYLKLRDEQPEEYYVLILLATLGASIIVVSDHFASFFLGLEILNISLYGLIAYVKSNKKCIEAGFKYVILAAASDAFFLFGIALLYLETGTMQFSKLAASFNPATIVSYFGFGMVFVGIGFKLAFVPFHLWTPDIYEGAPTPVTAFIATVSKGAVIAVLFRILTVIDFAHNEELRLLIVISSLITMTVGNLLALFQNNIKRILAYSSIAHIGYILIAFAAQMPIAILFYLITYYVTLVGAFGVITVHAKPDSDADDLENFRGLAWKHPFLAGIMSVMMLSLAGIPVTAGFIGKFYLFSAGVSTALWVLVTALVINSAMGLFYYLRILTIMYSRIGEQDNSGNFHFPFASGITLTVLLILTFALGIFPGKLITMLNLALPGM
jgi:NADH-quinone oxidoreductase subunit N